MSRFVRNRKAFSLIELLVVIAIIGVLIALLLPAVQSVREAARRTGCKNNLRQLGIALHNFESAFEHFPKGYAHITGVDFAAKTGYPVAPGYGAANHLGHGWGIYLLPFLEEQNLRDLIEMELPSFDPANLTARETSLSVFLCPSDGWSIHNFVVRDDTVAPPERAAAASYCANWGPASGVLETPGDTTDDVNLDATPDQSAGPFFRNSRTRFTDVLDGSSHTLAFGERTNGPILDDNGVPIGVPPHPNFETVWFGAMRDIGTPDDDHGHMVLFDAEYVPNFAHGAGTGADRGISAPHSGLAQFTFLDGSVHAIREDIDTVVYRALASMRGREIVPESF
jgi:prepilin-type N-terminal cleavage/methylation domain-containing protein/prepilin-type processing-associated H-X9-DG protein